MFMLRCIFWLTIMFASLPAGMGAIGAWRAIPAPIVTGTADALVDRAGGWCAARSGDCARDAVRLSGLVAAAVVDADDVRLPPVPAVASRTHARHRAARTVLTGDR